MPVLPTQFASTIIAVLAIFAIAFSATAKESPTPDAIRAKSEDVFKRPEFKRTVPKQAETKKPESKSFDTEPQQASTPTVGSGLVGLITQGLLIIGGVVLAIIIAMFIANSMRRYLESKSTVAKQDDAAAIVAQRAWLSENYRAQAKHLAEVGDYIEAIRFLFLALVYRFDESGRVSFHKEYTNREYLDLLSDRRNVRDLRFIVDILDDHWYGQQPCERKQYEECLRVYERLEE
jgi:hypothetical protein